MVLFKWCCLNDHSVWREFRNVKLEDISTAHNGMQSFLQDKDLGDKAVKIIDCTTSLTLFGSCIIFTSSVKLRLLTLYYKPNTVWFMHHIHLKC